MIDRLFNLLEQAEGMAKTDGATMNARDWLSIARGYLEAARVYGLPVNIARVGFALGQAINEVGTLDQRLPLLTKLQLILGWERSVPDTVT